MGGWPVGHPYLNELQLKRDLLQSRGRTRGGLARARVQPGRQVPTSAPAGSEGQEEVQQNEGLQLPWSAKPHCIYGHGCEARRVTCMCQISCLDLRE
jgi:hypothetical protein